MTDRSPHTINRLVFPHHRWIGKESNFIKWPPRSPDLSTCDNSLWAILKNKLRLKKYATIDQLKTAIKNVFSEIS